MENFQKGLSAAYRLTYCEQEELQLLQFLTELIFANSRNSFNSNTQVCNFRGNVHQNISVLYF